jgi:hypothetical protein
MKRICLFLLILFAGCQKENDPNITRDDYCGDYCGITSSGNISISIKKSDSDNNKVIIENLIGEKEIEAIVDGFKITIPEQTFHEADPRPDYSSDYYDLIFSGDGTMDANKSFLLINLTVKQVMEDTPDYTVIMTIELYNNSKYSFTGTYTGDSTTVIVSSVSDKPVLSIRFPEKWLPAGWENISVYDDVCSYVISTDSAYDISSGERYKLSGSVRKLGKNLHFSFTAYYQGYSPIFFYKFTVSKEE